MPRFIGEDDISAQKHIDSFYPFAKNLSVENLDVILRLFVQSLDGEAKKWFKTLPNDSINTWEEMENAFIKKWGNKKDYGYILREFNAMKKKHNEYVSKFIKMFNKLYNSLPIEIKPPQVVAKVFFSRAFELEFGFTLIERMSRTLDQIQTDALEVEANFTSTRMWKGKY